MASIRSGPDGGSQLVGSTARLHAIHEMYSTDVLTSSIYWNRAPLPHPGYLLLHSHQEVCFFHRRRQIPESKTPYFGQMHQDQIIRRDSSTKLDQCPDLFFMSAFRSLSFAADMPSLALIAFQPTTDGHTFIINQKFV